MSVMSDLKKTKTGFTLLEVMVALAMIAIVLVALFKLHHDTFATRNAARFHTLAPLLAQMKMAQLEEKSEEDLADDAGAFEGANAGYTWRTEISEVEVPALEVTANRLKKIEVSVSRNDSVMTYRLIAYRFF